MRQNRLEFEMDGLSDQWEETESTGMRHAAKFPRYSFRWPVVERKIRERKRLLLALTAYLVTGIAAFVTFKLETNALINYPMFTTQLNPIILAFLFGVGLNVEIRLVKHVVWSKVFTFPLWTLVGVSALDVLANSLEIISSDGMGKNSGPVMNLLSQCVIPFSIVFSMIFLKRSYHVVQLVGAAVIIGGVVLLVVISSKLAGGNVGYYLLYAASKLPSSLNKVVKEYLFGRYVITVLYVGFWEQVFNVAFGAFLALAYYPLIGDVPVDDISDRLVNATWCALGHNMTAGDDCGDAPWLIPLFNMSAVLWMASTLALVKYGSATVTFLASALLIPLSDFFFASRAIMGHAVSEFHLTDFLGLIVILLGMAVYGWGATLSPDLRSKWFINLRRRTDLSVQVSNSEQEQLCPSDDETDRPI